MTTLLARPWLASLLVVLVLFTGACSIDAGSVTLSRVQLATAAGDGLEAVGPSPGTSHWHAAYVVRICDQVLEPFTSEADPLGIHSHADGLIHVHPFFEQAGYEQARLGLFAEAMGLGLSDGELTLPDGGTWRDGDLCDDEPGRVFVDRWQGPTPDSAVTRHVADLSDIRFEADRELYQIAFAPPASPPVVPPSWIELDNVSAGLGDTGEPWVEVPPGADATTARVWRVAEITVAPCEPSQVVERTLVGEPRCFTPGEGAWRLDEAVVDARAVSFNRRPAVELTITPALRRYIVGAFAVAIAGDGGGLTLAIELDGSVVTAAMLPVAPQSPDRLIISGGFTAQTATRLAEVLAR